jgi:hypothetical protein
VNTYDPADGIVYIHMAREMGPSPTALDEDRRCARLPDGYANGSPSTSLRPPRSQPQKPEQQSPSRPSIPIQGKPGARGPGRRQDAGGRVDAG